MVPKGPKWQLFSNGLGDSVVPNRYQPSSEPVMTQYTDKCASLGHNVLTHGSVVITIGYNSIVWTCWSARWIPYKPND